MGFKNNVGVGLVSTLYRGKLSNVLNVTKSVSAEFRVEKWETEKRKNL